MWFFKKCTIHGQIDTRGRQGGQFSFRKNMFYDWKYPKK